MPRETIRTTTTGLIRGTTIDDVDAFLGVPYAAPPVGDLRFAAPAPHPAWDGVRDCVEFGNPAPQDNPDYEAWQDPVAPGEDCLVLNVWTPRGSAAGPLPVMIWIHGGAFVYGSAGIRMLDGDLLARGGEVVVVSVNHRLNAFGYLWLGDRFPELAGHANPGQQDLVAALRWVRDNIAAFGGDPGNVTVVGESGGGAKIGALLATPAAEGLFHKAIVQSGAQTRHLETTEADTVAGAFLAALDEPIADLARLREIPMARLLAAATAVIEQLGIFSFAPTVDGAQQVAHPWSGDSVVGAGLPLLIGTTRDETAPFYPEAAAGGFADDDEAAQRLLDFSFSAASLDGLAEAKHLIAQYRAQRPTAAPSELVLAASSDIWMLVSTQRALDARLKAKAAATFVYEFDWETPCFGGAWACHAAELPFIFGRLEYPTAWDGDDSDELRAAHDPEGKRFELREVMMSAWAAFAANGDPSTPRLAWPAYTATGRETALLGLPSGSSVENDPQAQRLEIVAHLRPGW
jgi:para-nitrobenzyl esterase